jgi:UDP-glucose 4-epimerase
MQSPGSGRVFNVGSGAGTSIEALTAAMLRVAGSSAEPLHEPPDWTAGSSRVANIDAIRTALRWQPRVTLEQGLRETWASLCEGGGA